MPVDLQKLKSVIEASVEDLVRVADTKINWNPTILESSNKKNYIFLPGVYKWEADKSALVAQEAAPQDNNPNEQAQPLEENQAPTDAALPQEQLTSPPSTEFDKPDIPGGESTPVAAASNASDQEQSQPPANELNSPTTPQGQPATPSHLASNASVAAYLLNDDDIASISYTLVLHGDNTFEYTWKQKRTGLRPMEHTMELYGTWHKPVLNRDRYGERDQRVFLDTARIRFQRLANFDPTTSVYKQTLRTLTRNGDDFVVCGENDRGLPPIRMVFSVMDDNVLESNGGLLPHDIIAHTIPSRILAGLTKKAGNKLGSPLDVVTDKWLPCRQLCLHLIPRDDPLCAHVKPFNPVLCLANALKSRSGRNGVAASQPPSLSKVA